MKPLFDNVLLKPQAPAQKIGGIVVPGSAKTETGLAQVLGVGEDVSKVTEGQKVYYAKEDAKGVEINGERLLILKEQDLLGVST